MNRYHCCCQVAYSYSFSDYYYYYSYYNYYYYYYYYYYYTCYFCCYCSSHGANESVVCGDWS